MKKIVAVIDYGMGNLRSVSKALEHVTTDTAVVVTSDFQVIKSASHIVLPGVGALRDCMSEIKRLDLIDLLGECAKNKPFLGICLGMHALLDHSEENAGIDGLGILPGNVLHFEDRIKPSGSDRLKIPHMGWNEVKQSRAHPLWSGIADNSRFYFVHSYYVKPETSELMAGATDYGLEFASCIARDNIFAAQFHPEKSQQAGLILLSNFLQWDGS
ncbi:MAG: imidazole glycerol phosphate synthase subunit HisH [Gammaproteobacteria bacterium]|nr:imidazole glycerol phosphate synthase subunit HisH [Gammaproteobacteria bacterium]